MLMRMKIGLFGYGKMGKMVEQLACEQGHSITDFQCADVCIDFSHPDVVLKHVKWAVHHQKPIVIGTTGWEAAAAAAKELIEKGGGAALASANFSLGMACFIKLLQHARSLFSDYEIAGVEYHHSQKKDSPSGTAKTIAHALEMATPFASVRCGRIAGKHEVIFDSPFDSITLTHEAHHREGFAHGAIRAAEWLVDKTGWFTFDDMLRSLYSSHHPL
jgi:4-hydroxy-tetrahydrodipicolinate reductase